MNHQIDRAWLLLSQGRYKDAEREAGVALAADPHSPQALVAMALCLLQEERFDEATEHAQRAVAHAPDEGVSHFALAHVWLRRSYLDRAADAAEEAIRLDPYEAPYHVVLGQIRLTQKRYPAALDAADAALAIDPENTDALNLRARALRQSGQKDAAARGLRDALKLDPDDADTHANLGWNYLTQGNLPKAQEHFREALRLEPGSEWARVGLVETIKAGNVAYRLILNWFLWMQKKAASSQWLIVIGAFVAYMICRQLVSANPSWGVVMWPLLGAYIAFCFCTWFALPLSNLALRLHPLGRLALSRRERIDATLVGLGVLLTLVTLVIHLFVKTLTTELIWIAALQTTVAVCMVTLMRAPQARKITTFYALAVGVISLVTATALPLAPWFEGHPGPLVTLWVAFTLLCFRLSSWTILGAVILANICATANWKDTPA